MLVVLKVLQAADWDQSCVALMPTKQETQPENRISRVRRLCFTVGYLKFFSFPFFVFFFVVVDSPFWCGHVYSSCVASMLLSGKLTGIPLGNPCV